MNVAKTAVSIASAKDAKLSLLKARRMAEELVRKSSPQPSGQVHPL